MPAKPDPLIPHGERVVAEYHPSPLTIPLWHHWALAACLMLALLVWLLERFVLNTSGGTSATSTWIRVVLAVMVWLVLSSLDVGVRRYIVTDKRLIVRLGVFARMVVDMPLSRVQHSVWTQSITQRVLGIGDVIVSSAGVDAPPIVFAGVGNPGVALETIRTARDNAAEPPQQSVTPVIGLVGGIGAGKSTVADAFGAMGCLVIDADHDAREAMNREDVVKELVAWWGPDILSQDGKIDRAKVAEIVFRDPAQRTRLESLIHPIVKSDRLFTIARARQEGRPAVIIDAPLLFEAGSDKDCDAVVFVDAPREQRLARVSARGWSPDELARREAAQLSLDQKRARANVVIQNSGSMETLQTLVHAALVKIRQDAVAGLLPTKQGGQSQRNPQP